MTYKVKEIFKTIQGEGGQAGRVMVFVRFAGCNLWSGREKDRANAICKFCDTDFVGGRRFKTADSLAAAIEREWGSHIAYRYVLFTGGEPMLQLDDALISACRSRMFGIGIETNGTLPVAGDISWVCVSPKAGADLQQTSGDELKLVYPQDGLSPDKFSNFGNRFRRYSLQPMDGPTKEANTAAAVAYCVDNPRWSLSAQVHKQIGVR